MTTKSYMPSDDTGKADLLDHLATTLPRYTGSLEISTEEIAALRADALSFRYTLNATSQMQSYAQHWTAFKNRLRDGDIGSADWPVPPQLDASLPTAVHPGIIPRLSALAARIKTHKKYTPPSARICGWWAFPR